MSLENFLTAGVLPTRVIGGDISKLVDRGLVLEPATEEAFTTDAVLPEGWELEAYPEDGENYARLLDHNGLPVAQIFYREDPPSAFIRVLIA